MLIEFVRPLELELNHLTKKVRPGEFHEVELLANDGNFTNIVFREGTAYGVSCLEFKVRPPLGSYAFTAQMMAENDDSGFDWDRWKDEMKERHL